MLALKGVSLRAFSRNIRPSPPIKAVPPAPPKHSLENKHKIRAMLENKFEEKELDRLIEQKMQEGKHDKQIVQELLGMPKRLSSHSQYLLRDKERIKKHRLDISNIFDIDKSALSSLSEKPLNKEELRQLKVKKEESSRAQKELEMYSSQMELIEQIEENTNLKKLLQGGIAQRASNKMTRQEKDEIQMNMAIMRQDILDRGELPPKQYMQRKNMEIKTYQYIPQEEIEEMQKESEKKEEKKEQSQKVDKKEEKKEQSQKVDKKEGLLKQFSELAKADTDKSDKGLDLYYEESKEGDRHKRREKVRHNDQLSTFSKQRKAYEQMVAAHGLDEEFLEDLAELETQTLFEEKARQESDKQFEEGMKRRQHRKQIKKMQKDQQRREIAEDMDWNQENKVGRVRQDKEFAGMVPDLAQWEQIEEHHRNSIDSTTDRQEQLYEYHRERTTRNYDRFIRQYVTEGNKSSLMSVTAGYKIDLKEVVTNNAMTVAYVFWDYRQQVEQDRPIREELTPKIEANLSNFSKMIRGVMCRELGLKYAPDVRFVKSEREKQVSSMLEDVKKQVPKMVMQEVESDFLEGREKDPQYKRLYTKEELNSLCSDYYQTIEEGVQTQTNHDQQLSQIRKAKQQARGRQNRNADGSRKRKKKDKQHRFNTFWDSLDD